VGHQFHQQFTQQGDIIFATWFTYDYTGAALPMSAQLNKWGRTSTRGTLIRTSGPPFNAVPFDPLAVIRTPVGTATVTLHQRQTPPRSPISVNDGIKTVTQTKSITRQVFRPTGNGVPVGPRFSAPAAPGLATDRRGNPGCGPFRSTPSS
jgi:hypothetical protein